MKHNPMQSLINLAQMRQEARLKQLGHLLAAGRSQEEKLALLQNYRKDYQAKLTAGSQRGIAPHELANFKQFMDQLELAILRQDDSFTQSLTQSEYGRQRWQESLRALRSFETLLERRARTARNAQSRREQASDDEVAARQMICASISK